MSESPRSLEELRQLLLDQLIYLVDEIEALGVIIDRVPEPVLEGHPLQGELSIKEMYGLIAVSDERVRLPALRRIVTEDHPSLEEFPSLEEIPSLEEFPSLEEIPSLEEVPSLEEIQSLEEIPSLEEVEGQHLVHLDNWNDKPIRNILDRLIEARRNLHGFLAGIDSQTWLRSGRWGTEDRDLFALVHGFIQHDVDLLRSIALRLHVSRL